MIKIFKLSQEIKTLNENDIEGSIEDNLKTDNSTQEVFEPNVEDIVEDNIVEDNKGDFASNDAAIYWAFNNNTTLIINYKTLSGFSLKREVEPHGFYYSPATKNNILVTFDNTVKGIRSFILKNILDFQILNKKFNKKFTF